MRILLIYPYFLYDRDAESVKEISAPPIGLYYIAALLRENHYEVEILNWFDAGKTPDKIEETLRQKRPDVIGFSILNANRWGGIEIARIAKRIHPPAKIVFGGVGTTCLWEHLLTHFSEIDYAVLGEGEYSFLNLLRCLEKDNPEELGSIKGIAYRKGKEIVSTEREAVISDLDSLPMPSQYFEFHHLISSRGCPSNCTFCGSPRLWGRRVRFHSAEYFVNQLEQLYRKGITKFYVSDDTFTVRKDRVIEICRKILERGLKIRWFAISRVNYVDEEMLYWMRKAGCVQISYGVESGSEKIREGMNKNIKTEDIKRAFSLTTSYGMVARAYFIIGSPGESWETIRETMDLIHEIKPLIAIFYVLAIFPGTALYEDFKRRTKLDDDIWLERIEDIQYFNSDPLLSEDLIADFRRKVQADYYRHVPEFIEAVRLRDREDLHEKYADFFVTLASNFSDGGFFSASDEISGREEIAGKLYERALSYYPDEKAYLGLGLLKQRQGKYEESLGVLSEGMKQFPASRSLAYFSGMGHMHLRRYEQAAELFLKSLAADPYYANAHFNLANAYMQRGMADKAVQEYLLTVQLQPDHLQARNNLGNAFMMRKAFDGAISQYKEVIALQGDNFDAHCNLGTAYLNKGLMDEAQRHYEIALHLHPDNADAHFNLGLVYLQKREKEKAIEEFMETLRLNPNIKEARDLITALSNA